MDYSKFSQCVSKTRNSIDTGLKRKVTLLLQIVITTTLITATLDLKI